MLLLPPPSTSLGTLAIVVEEDVSVAPKVSAPPPVLPLAPPEEQFLSALLPTDSVIGWSSLPPLMLVVMLWPKVGALEPLRSTVAKPGSVDPADTDLLRVGGRSKSGIEMVLL